MKNYKQILEAVNKGIQLALDDMEGIEDNNSISSDIIDTEDVIKYKLIIHRFIPSIMKMCEKSFYECITYKDYFKFVDAVNKLNRKIKLGMPGAFGDYQFKQIVQHIIFGLVDKYSHINLNWIDTSDVKDMSYLLANFPGNVNVSEWDVSNVNSMNGLFAGSNFNGNLSKWDVSNVKDMMAMFEHSKFNNDSIKNWNISSVKNMSLMFMESELNQDMNDWDWNIKEDCTTTAMFSRSKMKLENIPEYLKKSIKKHTVKGFKII